MSIFIAIPSLIDNQTVYTVKNAIKKAKYPKDISVGVAFMTEESYFQEQYKKIKKFKQVKCKRFNFDENFGVGIGRKNAMSFYNNEDYVLQIDSHTFFEKNWDVKLIEIFEKAKEETQNEKTIITSYIGEYIHPKRFYRRKLGSGKSRYSFILQEKMRTVPEIPAMGDRRIEDTIHIEKIDTQFLPSVKFCAQFAFGNKHFVNSNSVPDNIIFFEEEIIQTINLIDQGFSLVFPNMEIPLRHLYYQDVDEYNIKSLSFRRGVYTNVVHIEELHIKEGKNFVDFIQDPNNLEKVNKFRNYSKMDPLGIANIYQYIPEDYSR